MYHYHLTEGADGHRCLQHALVSITQPSLSLPPLSRHFSGSQGELSEWVHCLLLPGALPGHQCWWGLVLSR